SLGATLFKPCLGRLWSRRFTPTGPSAQRGLGEGDGEQRRSFYLPLLFAISTAAVFLAMWKPVEAGYLWLTGPEQAVADYVRRYFRILIWGAPFVLSNYVMLGWLMGQRRIGAALFMQISGNLINMVLDYLFVRILGCGVEGVAAATLISQVYTCICGILGMCRYGRFGLPGGENQKSLWDRESVVGMIQENRDLLLRTICLVMYNNLFAAFSGRLGTDLLAVNAIMVQITSVQAYVFEGIANGSSVFAGRAAGAASYSLLRDVIKKTWQWGAAAAVVMTGISIGAGDRLIGIFTGLSHIRELAGRYELYYFLYPVTAFAGLSLYGVYTGSSITRPVFLSTLWALLACLPVSCLGVFFWGNDGLWMGYLAFYGGRSLGLAAYRDCLFMKMQGRSLPERRTA
ncbi:MAG: MATE family efflux transporter, partial [Clostridium sp.]|nr:MATE family efflux transporter [Clostridium sp.]